VTASYSFGGSWYVAAPMADVRDAIIDLEHYPEWWPQVRAVASLGPDDAWVVCRSALPYTLDLVLHAVSREVPVLEVAVSGDLDGFVRWRLSEEPSGTRMVLEQEVTVSGLLGVASYALRPVLRWNHHRMMTSCVTGLRKRLNVGRAAGSVRA
jgi:Polyketide cyclase / dehydrase and lipid transport